MRGVRGQRAVSDRAAQVRSPERSMRRVHRLRRLRAGDGVFACDRDVRVARVIEVASTDLVGASILEPLLRDATVFLRGIVGEVEEAAVGREDAELASARA